MLTVLTMIAAVAQTNAADVIRANPGSLALDWMNQYSVGDAPAPTEVMGYFPGRCYALVEPNKPLGYVLMGEARWVKGADGSRQAVTKVTVAGGWILKNQANTPDEFDNPNGKSLGDMKAEMDRVFADSKFSPLYGDKEGNRLYSDNGTSNVRFEIRANNKRHLVARMTRLSDGAELASCYFFRRLELRQRLLNLKR